MADTAPSILVAVDFSDNGRKAFDAAMNLAEDTGAPLVVLHVFPAVKAPSLLAGDMAKKVIDEARAEISKEEAMTLSEEWVSVARERGLDVEAVATDGRPSQVILDEAKERGVAVIVVGTHGRTGIKHAFLGSVAEEVVKGSDRPVLVVPMKKS